MLALFLAAGPASAWEEYVRLDQGVAIRFPAKPLAMKSTYESIFVKRLPAMFYSVEADHVLHKLTVIDLTDRPDMGSNPIFSAACRMPGRRGCFAADRSGGYHHHAKTDL